MRSHQMRSFSAARIRLCSDVGGGGRVHLEQQQLPLCFALLCEPFGDGWDGGGVCGGHGAVVLDIGASYPFLPSLSYVD